MYKIVFLNQGESEWDNEKMYIGWTDVGLTEKGVAAAKKAGEILAANEYYLEFAFVSMLKRSLQTLFYALEASEQLWIPWEKSWKLNDRHWGALQGIKQREVIMEYGEKQVQQWSKSYKVKPPQTENKDQRFPGNNRMYRDYPVDELPSGESMEEVTKRVVQYWLDEISPVVKSEQKVLISGHTDSLKAIIKHLERIPDEKLSDVSVEAGRPLVYELDSNLYHRNHYYLD